MFRLVANYNRICYQESIRINYQNLSRGVYPVSKVALGIAYRDKIPGIGCREYTQMI